MRAAPRFAPPLFVPERVDSRYKPDRKRARRSKALNGWTSSRPPIAKILTLEGGGYWRPVITRGGNHLRFRLPSRKTGLTQVGEGKGEQRFALLNEVDALVWDYQCHPWQIISQVNGKRFKYRPDVIRVLVDGTIEVIEVKRTFEDLSDAAYRDMLGQVKEICRQCGFRFRVMYLEDIIPNDDHRDNVDVLFGRRYMTLTTKQERECRTMRHGGISLTWRDARARLGGSDILEGDAVLECATARGMFAFDLSVARSDDTLLTPIRPISGNSPIRL